MIAIRATGTHDHIVCVLRCESDADYTRAVNLVVRMNRSPYREYGKYYALGVFQA